MGMLTVEGVEADTVWVALSPMAELALSLLVMRSPARYPFHAAWLAPTSAGRAAVSMRRLVALVNPTRRPPDFLFEGTTVTPPTFEAHLDRLTSLPAQRFTHDLQAADAAPPSVFGDSAEAVKQGVLDAISAYWHGYFAEHWPRCRLLLEEDVALRFEQRATQGEREMLRDIDPRIIPNHGRIVCQVAGGVDTRLRVGQVPLTVMPTLITTEIGTPNSAASELVLTYPARGQRRVFVEAVRQAPGGLEAILGAARTRVLLAVDHPSSATELAVVLGTSPSAIGQHARTLCRLGLLTSDRSERGRIYRRPDVGELVAEVASARAQGW